MLNPSRQLEIRKLVKKYKDLLGLKNYRLSIKFVTAAEDSDLKGKQGVMRVSSLCRTIYIEFSKRDCQKMEHIQLKRLIIHELLHVFFWDISGLFDNVVDKNIVNNKKRKKLKKRFENIEEYNVNHLVEAFIRMERKMKTYQKEKLHKKIEKIFNSI